MLLRLNSSQKRRFTFFVFPHPRFYRHALTTSMATSSEKGLTTVKQNVVIIPDLTIKDLLGAIP